MNIVRITGWHPGLRKVSLTQTIMRVCGYDLASAKRHTDRLLDGVPVRLPLVPTEDPTGVITELEDLGAIASLEAFSQELDSAQRYLLKEGYPDHVVAGGLTGLLDAWHRPARGLGSSRR